MRFVNKYLQFLGVILSLILVMFPAFVCMIVDSYYPMALLAFSFPIGVILIIMIMDEA